MSYPMHSIRTLTKQDLTETATTRLAFWGPTSLYIVVNIQNKEIVTFEVSYNSKTEFKRVTEQFLTLEDAILKYNEITQQ